MSPFRTRVMVPGRYRTHVQGQGQAMASVVETGEDHAVREVSSCLIKSKATWISLPLCLEHPFSWRIKRAVRFNVVVSGRD